MERLKRQFGPKVAQLVAASPTLTRDLKLLRERQVRIVRLKGVCRAYSLSTPRQRRGACILISRDCPPVQTVLFLAHEAWHVLRGRTNANPNPSKISRTRYIERALGEEMTCQMRELRVTRELFNAGFFVGYANLSWLTRLLEFGRAHLIAELRPELRPDGESYEQYFGRLYDLEVARRLRKKKKNLLRSRRTA